MRIAAASAPRFSSGGGQAFNIGSVAALWSLYYDRHVDLLLQNVLHNNLKDAGAHAGSVTCVVVPYSGCRILRGPVSAQDFRLFQSQSSCRFLQVGWILVFAEDTSYVHPNVSLGAFADMPVNRDAVADSRD